MAGQLNRRSLMIIVLVMAVTAALALVTARPPADTAVSALPTQAVLPTQAEPTARPASPTPAPERTGADAAAVPPAASMSLPAAGNAPVLPLPAPDAAPLPPQPVPGQVVIAFSPRASAAEQQAYIAQIGGTVVQDIAGLNSVVVSLPAGSAAELLPASPAVAAAEPDYFVTALADAPASDPYYGQQWALPVIGAPDAWLELPAEMPPVVVAVIDSGICASHPDLAGRVLPGWDFVENDADPQDAFGHGCGVAGIIAANRDTVGIAGVAPNAALLPLRVLDQNGVGTYSNVAAAIVRAADSGAQVINLSLGGANPASVLQSAVDYAIGKGALVIAAAGNTGGAVLYPAAYAPVIAVASVDSTLQRSSFSSFGPEVDLLAPGRDILTTSADGAYKTMTGTSFAAPHAAGVAAAEVGRGRRLALGGLLRFATDFTPPTTPPPPDNSVTPTPTTQPDQPVSIPSMRNPAAVYCGGLGYAYETVSVPGGGQDAVCIMPDGERCPQWDFYRGTCGQPYNYCASQGLNTVTLTDGQDPFSAVYAACTDSTGQVIGSVNELSSLSSRATGCADGACAEVPVQELSAAVSPAEDWVSGLAVPSSLDWRNYRGGNWLTGVRSQDACGSCWAFAAVGAAEAALKIGAVNLSWQPDLAEQQLVSTCDSSFWRGTCGGGSSQEALKYIRDIGLVSEACMPYTATDAMCTRCGTWASQLTKINATAATWYWNGAITPQYIKQNLVARGPVVVYMDTASGYWSGDVMRCTNDYPDTGSTVIDHSVVAVGYNDAGGYWIIRNSWGEWFGDNGYFKVGYGECNIDRTVVAYAQQTIPAPTLQTPAASATLDQQQVTFSWQASGTPLQNAYNFRINTYANPDWGVPLVNTTTTSASYSHTFTTSGMYYWHVRTASDGGDSSGWVTRAVTIDITPPVNDNFASSRLISALPYSDSSIRTRWASLQAGEPTASCMGNEGRSVWYRYTPAVSDVVTFRTQGSNYDTVLSVWTGTAFANLSEATCNDDFYGTQSEVTFFASARTTYYIRVTGWDSSYGSLTLAGVSASVKDAAELAAAINAANAAGGGDIYLVPNRVYTLTGSGSEFGLPPVISGSDITIHGFGATIQRSPTAPNFRLFGVSLVGTLTLNNLTLSGGRALNGGAIYNSGTLNLDNVTFSQNHADSSGGGLYNVGTVNGWNVRFFNNDAGSFGGGVYIWDAGSSAYFSNSEFRANSAVNDGGALRSEAGTTLTLNQSMVRDNSANYGGGLVNAGTAYVYTTTFMGNNAHEGGGAISNEGTLTLRDSFVRVNNANYGGGLINWNSMTIERTTFADNIARSNGGWGGGIYNTGTLTLTDDIFNNNRGIYGGALKNYIGAVTINSSVFVYNVATWGGAIHSEIPLAGMGAQSYETAGADGLAVSAGTPPQPPAGLDLGLSAAGVNKMTLTDTEIGFNHANYGGGLYNYAGEINGHNLNIHHNGAHYDGGGLYNVWDGTTAFSFTTFRANRAVFDGGGAVNLGLAVISDSQFEENETVLYHGGGLANHGQATVYFTDFVRNHAEGSGGAVYNTGSADLGGFYLLNSAYYDGGAVINYGHMTAAGQFGSNRAGYNGGAIASVNGSLVIASGSLVEYNEASYLGGGLYYQAVTDSTTVAFDEVTFFLNQAGQGGAVYAKNSTGSPAAISANHVEIYGNKANDGGAVTAEVPFTISQSCITSNYPTALVSGEGAFISADGNWWGMADGPSGNGPGSGDSISANVSYGGFMTAQPDDCAPANDMPATAAAITHLPYSLTQSSSNAHLFDGDPAPSCGPGGPYINTVWYVYDAPRAGVVRFDTAGSGYDTLVSVWTGAPGSFTEMSCNDNALGLGTASQVEFTVARNTTYYVMVADTTGMDGGPLQAQARLLPPANDDIAQAVDITNPPLTHYANTIEASVNVNDPVPSCAGPLNRTVWYRYASPDGSSLRFSTTESEYTAALSVWADSGSGLVEKACSAVSGIIDMQAEPGTVYYIMAGDTGAGGSLTFVMPLPLRVPVVAAPGDGASVALTQPMFTWGPVTGAARYEVRLGTAPTFTREPYSVAGASYRPALQLMTTTYYWQVRAIGTSGNASAWSDLRSVQITSPANATPGRNHFTTPTPLLSWGRVSNASSYEVQVSTSSVFMGPLAFTATLNASTFEVAVHPLPDGTYYWHVRARRADGVWGPWSFTDSFVIDAP